MKLILNIIVLILVMIFPERNLGAVNELIRNKSTIEEVIKDLISETQIVSEKYHNEYKSLHEQLESENKFLLRTKSPLDQLSCLINKDRIKERIKRLMNSERTEISKIRYIKGVQIIKILYEKTLALDHHFASVSTLHEINRISNPNQYPEFSSVKELLNSKNGKKTGFNLSSVLGDNLYTSIVHSFISLFTDTSTTKKQKEASLSKVECILDFTLQMHNDLSTIYFETKFLQKNNDNIINELHQLFVDFTKPISYSKPLKECRDTDDWGQVREHLEAYLVKLDLAIDDTSSQRISRKMQINLEFPIDRLLQFISQYNAFIDQGAKFYEKFGIMLNSYQNETSCASKIPIEYQQLKENIAIATEKFNTAYKPVEINGSKMKEILYGINEYE